MSSRAILHQSTQRDKVMEHASKKVAIISACTSAHNIAAYYIDNSVNIVLIQCTSTYIMTNKEGMLWLIGCVSPLS